MIIDGMASGIDDGLEYAGAHAARISEKWGRNDLQAKSLQPPPRSTRSEPEAGPMGSISVPG